MGGGMRLRNKKTGEIKSAEAMEDGIYLYDEITKQWYKYELDLLAECWEYYEEPKDFWFIDPEILIACESTDPLLCDKKVAIETMKQIGNYFDSREEAEKAVEKLKAWKRLKDKGFRFEYYDYSDRDLHNHIQIKAITNREVEDSMLCKEYLDLLFGGEE